MWIPIPQMGCPVWGTGILPGGQVIPISLRVKCVVDPSIQGTLAAVGDRIDDDNTSCSSLLCQLRQHQASTACSQHEDTIAGLDCGAVDATYAASQWLNEGSLFK